MRHLQQLPAFSRLGDAELVDSEVHKTFRCGLRGHCGTRHYGRASARKTKRGLVDLLRIKVKTMMCYTLGIAHPHPHPYPLSCPSIIFFLPVVSSSNSKCPAVRR